MENTSRIQELRKKKGFSQQALSEASGLSLRTIQRLEKNPAAGSPYSLKSVADALEVTIEDFFPKPKPRESHLNPTEKKRLKSMNLSALTVLIVPLGNLLFPALIFWKTGKDPAFLPFAKKVLSFQIVWTLVTLFLVFALPPLILFLIDMHQAGGVPYGIPVYFLSVSVNVLYVVRIAAQLSKEEPSLHFLPNIL